jgi:Flp pilus assembly protein TadD
MGTSPQVSEAERAIASGDLARAAGLLRQAAEERPNEPQLWMKVAAIHRGMGQPKAALAALHRGLAA